MTLVSRQRGDREGVTLARRQRGDREGVILASRGEIGKG